MHWLDKLCCRLQLPSGSEKLAQSANPIEVIKGALPTNLITLTEREVANSFATDLREMTSDMMVREYGAPAHLELAEAEDAAT